jgi:hypothetical protein
MICSDIRAECFLPPDKLVDNPQSYHLTLTA